MAAYERHAYEMVPVRSISERRVYERHAYGMVYWRCTPIKCPSIGDICLEDTFNQFRLLLPFGTPKWPRSYWSCVVFLLLWRRQIVTPRSQSCEGVLGLGGVAKGVLPSHSLADCRRRQRIALLGPFAPADTLVREGRRAVQCHRSRMPRSSALKVFFRQAWRLTSWSSCICLLMY